MTDTTAIPAVPSLVQQILRAVAQKGVTALATALTGYGLLPQAQSAQFIVWGMAGAAWAFSFGWTYFHEKHDKQAKDNAAAVVATLQAEPPIVVVSK